MASPSSSLDQAFAASRASVHSGRSKLLLAAMFSMAAALVFAILAQAGILALAIAFVMVGTVAIALLKPDFATVAVVFAIYANLAPAIARAHAIPKLVAASIFLLLLIPAAYYLVIRRTTLRIDRVLLLLCVYFCLQLASILFSEHVGDSLFPVASYVCEGILVYWLLLNAVRTPEMVRRCVWAMILAGVMLSSLSVLQNVTQSFDHEYAGLAMTHLITKPLEESRVETADATDSRLRAMGSIGDPNYYGQILVTLLPILALRIWAERKSWLRWCAAAMVVFVVGALVLTFSRGAALTACIVLAALVPFRYIRLRYAAVLLLIVAAVVMATPDYRARVLTLTEVGSHGLRAGDASVRERSAAMSAGFEVFLHHPLVGVGVGQSPYYLPQYSQFSGYGEVRRTMGPHNMYVGILAETGLIGFMAFGAIVLTAVLRLFRLRARCKLQHPEYLHTVTSLLLAIFAFLVTGMFLHLAYGRYLWLVIAIAGAAYMVYSKELDTPQQSKSATAAQLFA